MEFEDRSIVLKYGWDYFLAHAQARLTAFRFYLAYSGAIGAGMVASFGKQPWVFIGLSFLLSFLTAIYWQIDQRHRYIVKKAQKALVDLETSGQFPTLAAIPSLRLFSNDMDEKTKGAYYLTYSKLVHTVFLVFFAAAFSLGVSILVVELCR